MVDSRKSIVDSRRRPIFAPSALAAAIADAPDAVGAADEIVEARSRVVSKAGSSHSGQSAAAGAVLGRREVAPVPTRCGGVERSKSRSARRPRREGSNDDGMV